MKVAAVIPARMESTRFFGKMLAPLLGFPLVGHVWRNVSRMHLFEEVIIATPNTEIVDALKPLGAHVVQTPSSGIENGTERVAWVTRHYGRNWDWVINIQGDEPLLSQGALLPLYSVLRTTSCPIVTLARWEADVSNADNHNIVKVVCDAQSRALYFSRLPLLVSPEGFLAHVGVYAYQPALLENLVKKQPCPAELYEKLEQLRALYYGWPIHVAVGHFDSVAVDVPSDIVRVEDFLRSQSLSQK